MQVSVTEAKGQLTELVRRAEAGEEVDLTRHGACSRAPCRSSEFETGRRCRALLDAGVRRLRQGLGRADAARSQDFLYDEDGLPR